MFYNDNWIFIVVLYFIFLAPSLFLKQTLTAGIQNIVKKRL